MSTIRRSQINRANKIGDCYLLHFEQPYPRDERGDCRHYIGFTKRSIRTRLREHWTGNGSALTSACHAAGIKMQLARVWRKVDKSVELILKSRGEAAALCPECSGEAAYNRARYDEQEESPC